jgi:Putative citrate transport
MSAFSPGRIVRASLFASVMMTATPAMAAQALDGARLPWPLALPFAGMLLSIALGPLAVKEWWHIHYAKAAGFWAALTLIDLVAAQGHRGRRSGFRAQHVARRPCGAHRFPRPNLDGDFARRGSQGRQHLNRQCAKLHDLCDCAARRHQHVWIFPVNEMVGRCPSTPLRGDHMAVLNMVPTRSVGAIGLRPKARHARIKIWQGTN